MIRRALRKTRQAALRHAETATHARLGIVTMTPGAFSALCRAGRLGALVFQASRSGQALPD